MQPQPRPVNTAFQQPNQSHTNDDAALVMFNTSSNTSLAEAEGSALVDAYRELTGGFVQVAVTILLVIAALSVLLLATVLCSACFVVRCDPVIRFTYSLITANLLGAAIMFWGLIVNSTQVFDSRATVVVCVQMMTEALKLALLFTELLHVSVLSVLHYLAVARPMLYKEATRYAVYPGILLLWLAPTLISLLIHALILLLFPDAMHVCMSPFFNTDVYRFAVVIVFAVPIATTFACYVGTFHRMRNRFVRRSAVSVPSASGMEQSEPFVSTSVVNTEGNAVILHNTNSEYSQFNKMSKSLDMVNIQNNSGTDSIRSRTDASSLDMASNELHLPADKRSSSRSYMIKKTFNRCVHSMAQSHGNRDSDRLRRRHRTLQFTLLVFCVFFLSWAPGVLWLGLLCHRCAISQMYLIQNYPWLLAGGSVLTNFPMYIKYPINAFLYALRMPNIQTAMCRMGSRLREVLLPCAHSQRTLHNDGTQRKTEDTFI